ncbi:MAG TPA: type II toxin-antitoxin system VapC family toxin [Thermoanaerobaculia bacterium]|jgi:predicted nucleic acid-binding protein|nr:type II toxin-antitoxin system VapC family toxin [Thermoanaerobaculia bacterium]
MARVYLDSCVVIYLIQGPAVLSRAILAELQPAESEPPLVYVSDLTRLECRVWPLRQGDSGLLNEFDRFFTSEGLQTIPFESKTFDQATELRAAHGTKTPDALHLAAAIVAGCTEFWTNDPRLRSAAGDQIALKMFS